MTQDPLKAPSTPRDISDEALRWIVRLHSGEATAEDRKQFREWRSASPENEEAAREAEDLWGDASDLHEDPVTGTVRPGARKSGPHRRNIVAGLVALVISGSGLAVFNEWRADYITGRGEVRTVGLPDGSRVTLNARSAINLKFSEAGRRISLVQGQAFFEVAPDAVRPFEVDAAGVTVTALGTAFDIERNLATGDVVASVTQHSVTVGTATTNNSRSAARVTLREDQTVAVDAQGHIGTISARASSVTTAWRSGMYIAENRSLGDVVAALQAYHVGWIVIRGEKATGLRVNAVLNLKTPDESLDALANGLPIAVWRLSPFLVIISNADEPS